MPKKDETKKTTKKATKATSKTSTTKSKVSGTGTVKQSKAGSKSKKTSAGSSQTRSKRTKASEQRTLGTIEDILINSYGLSKFKNWTEQSEEVSCKQVTVSVASTAGKTLHAFQIKLYLRELAEKEGFALTNLQLYPDHFEFTLVQPVSQKPILE